MTQVTTSPAPVVAPDEAEHPQRLLSEQQVRMWRKIVRVNAQLLSQLEATLVAEHGLALAEYDVLAQLADSPQRRLRMSELAQRVLLSRSGLTRLVDRMTTQGFIERQACLSDARGLYAVLTEAGYLRVRGATRSHYRSIHAHVLGMMSPHQHACLEDILDQVLQQGSS